MGQRRLTLRCSTNWKFVATSYDRFSTCRSLDVVHRTDPYSSSGQPQTPRRPHGRPQPSPLRSPRTLGLVGWPRNANSRLLNKFSNSFYGDAGPRWIFGATPTHTPVFDKLEVRRHGGCTAPSSQTTWPGAPKALGQDRHVRQTCSGLGRVPPSRAEFRFHPGLDDEFPPTTSRATVHDPRVLG